MIWRAGIHSTTEISIAAGRAVLRDAASSDHRGAVAAVVARVAEVLDVDVALEVGGSIVAPDRQVETAAASLPTDWVRSIGAELPGLVREDLVSSRQRRAAGVHHTPAAVAEAVVGLCFDALSGDGSDASIADPTVGGGVFLLAAGRRLVEQTGFAPADVVGRLSGVDIDPLAVGVTRSALELWSGVRLADEAVTVADFLGPRPLGEHRPTVIVGNPPFLSPLLRDTARETEAREEIRERWPGVGGYVDTAGLFWLAALEAVDEHGVVALITPSSFLSARDSASVRHRLVEAASVTGFWHASDPAFAAGVDACAVVARRGVRRVPVAGLHGPTGSDPLSHEPVTHRDDLARLHAAGVGVPRVESRSPTSRVLGDVARCTAGFRDEYYGLTEAVVDHSDGGVRLVTSGLIDPLRSRWGDRACRYGGRRFDRPAVALERVAANVAGWVEQRLRPKLVVASQTAVIEAAVDVHGNWVPCTPVVSVEPTGDGPSLWHLAAVLSAPPSTARLANTMSGSARSNRALRVSARSLAALPIPEPGAAWDQAALACRQASESNDPIDYRTIAELCAAAFGPVDHDLVEWWLSRLPAGLRRASAGSG